MQEEAPGRRQRSEPSRRGRRFTREQIAKRNGSLDISWLQDDNARAGEELPDPADIADEILAQLSIATEETQELVRLLTEEAR